MSSNRGLNVLIAEDDFLVVEMIKGLLRELGHTVVGHAVNGREAVAMTKELAPDVVLMDIKMPEMDGIEAAGHIERECPTPLVVVTAHESPALVKRASHAGVGAYLVKPPMASEIDRAITVAMARFKDMAELSRLNRELTERNEELQQALAQIQTLRGLIPICASCKKIRDDAGYWQQVDVYLREHTQAEFTHGLCPDCAAKLYPDVFAKKKK